MVSRLSYLDFITEEIPHKAVVPNGLATALAVRFNLVPSSFTTKVLRMVAIEIFKGRIPPDASIQVSCFYK
jgi:hypothetical protein